MQDTQLRGWGSHTQRVFHKVSGARPLTSSSQNGVCRLCGLSVPLQAQLCQTCGGTAPTDAELVKINGLYQGDYINPEAEHSFPWKAGLTQRARLHASDICRAAASQGKTVDPVRLGPKFGGPLARAYDYRDSYLDIFVREFTHWLLVFKP